MIQRYAVRGKFCKQLEHGRDIVVQTAALIWLVETTLKKIRQGGEEGCSMRNNLWWANRPLTPLFKDWADRNEEDILFKIRNGITVVQCYPVGQSSPRFELNFYASPTSGMFELYLFGE
jgi:hypothetical protein